MSTLKENSALISRLAIISSFVLGILAICGATYGCVSKYQEYRAEQAIIKKDTLHKEAQASIRSMIELCGFARISDAEQESITKCGDDVEAARFALGLIIDSRVVFWKTTLSDTADKVRKLLDIKNSSSYWSVSNEATFRQVGKKLIADHEEAQSQLNQWQSKGKKLKELSGKSTLEHKAPAPKSSGASA